VPRGSSGVLRFAAVLKFCSRAGIPGPGVGVGDGDGVGVTVGVGVGIGEELGAKATASITHQPEDLSDAPAVNMPGAPTTESSNISPSGYVITRSVKPVPADLVDVTTQFPATITAPWEFVFTEHEDDVPEPVDEPTASTLDSPLYSASLKSAY
jgi:hypothetical protein